MVTSQEIREIDARVGEWKLFYLHFWTAIHPPVLAEGLGQQGVLTVCSTINVCNKVSFKPVTGYIGVSLWEKVLELQHTYIKQVRPAGRTNN